MWAEERKGGGIEVAGGLGRKVSRQVDRKQRYC